MVVMDDFADQENSLRLERQTRKIMLQTYRQNLIAARRLARYTVRKRIEQGLSPDDPDPSHKRKAFTTKIAQELYDSLLFYPDSSPVVEEIRSELGEALGKTIEFTYPPGGTLRIAVREKAGLRQLNDEEQRTARETLRRITSAKVDEGLVNRNSGFNTRI